MHCWRSVLDLPLGYLSSDPLIGHESPVGTPILRQVFSEVYPDYFRIARMRVGIREGLGDHRFPLASIRADGHKLVLPERGAPRLFDLARDPSESENVAADRPERVLTLRSELQAWQRAHPLRRDEEASDAPPMDDETRRRLEALGYL